jgi:hypothetical protein
MRQLAFLFPLRIWFQDVAANTCRNAGVAPNHERRPCLIQHQDKAFDRCLSVEYLIDRQYAEGGLFCHLHLMHSGFARAANPEMPICSMAAG